MTEQHCDHECVCGVLMVAGIEGDTTPCDFGGCLHDTRSRPASTPTPDDDIDYKLALKEMKEIYLNLRRPLRQLLSDAGVVSNPAVGDDWILEQISSLIQHHEATIRQQERERVLDKVISFCKSNDCVQATYGDQDCMSTTDSECVICFCESLRSTTQEDQG